MKHILLAISLVFLIAATSCTNEIEDKNTATIDSLLTHVTDAQRALSMLDSTKLAGMLAEYESQYAFFNAAETDTSNKDFYTGPMMDMMTCRKRINKTLMFMHQWKYDLEKAEKQLTNLRHDYAHKLIEGEAFEKSLITEGSVTTEVVGETTKYIGTTSNCIGNFDALIARLDSAQNTLSAAGK